MMETAAQRYDYAFRQTVGYSANAIGESNACDFKATYQPELDRDKERLLKQWSRGQLIVDAVAQVPGLEQKLDDYWKFKHKSEYPDRYRLFDVAFYVEQEWLYPKGEHHHIRWISTLGPF